MKLALGTVQFGLSYGVSNTHGQTQPQEISKILNTAKAHEIELLDTAYGYGNSEEVLGQSQLINDFSIVTKIPPLSESRSSLRDYFNKSLQNLRQEKVYGLLFHNVVDLLGEDGEEKYREIGSLKEFGLVNKIGVSVYTVEQLERVISRFKIDLVQLPLNILDQRFLKNGFLRKLKSMDIEIHIRSVFLQGLLLMAADRAPSYFEKMKPLLLQLQNDILLQKFSKIAACLSFVKSIPEIDKIIIGVNTEQQLQEVLKAYKQDICLDFKRYQFVQDDELLQPIHWRLK